MRSGWCVGALVLGLLAGCGEDPPDGRQVFVTSGCARCHESDGSGGSLGPSLEGLQAKWTAEELNRFLADPPAYMAQDKRLQKYQEEYFTPMPKLDIDSEKRRALVVFLLNEQK